MAGNYPGKISNVLEATGLEYLDPIAEFANAQLAASLKAEAHGTDFDAEPAIQRPHRRRPFLARGLRTLGRRRWVAGSIS